MPELPEVETMVRGIRPQVEGRSIDSFEQCPCDCQPLSLQPSWDAMQARVTGATITRVWRRAKRVVLDLSTTEAIVIEPRMTGLMLLADPPDEGHLRLHWGLTRGRERSHLYFWDRRGLGTVRLLSAEELAERLGPRFLGTDALDLTADELFLCLRRTDRPVKVALLDQKLVAGIGNLYASEILHRAGVHPGCRASRISKVRVGRVHAAMRDILLEAIRYEGSTLADGTYRNALNRDGSYQNEHRVYAKAGTPCPTCGTGEIVRIVQAQRSTFYCPRCQRR